MNKYEFLDDLTSDVLFKAYGSSLKEVFENSAYAMFEVICHDVESKIKKEVSVEGKDSKDLLFNWLSELITLVDTEEMFFSKFDIKEISENKLRAEIWGESVSREKGETLVKSVTYYKFGLEKTEKGYESTVSLDI